MATNPNHPLVALGTGKPAKWDLDFKVPPMPRLQDIARGRKLSEAHAEYDQQMEAWRRNLENATAERIRSAQQTAATTEPAAGTSTTIVAADGSLAARVSALEALVALLTEGRVIVLCAGWTPAVTGADFAEVEVPHNPGGHDWSVARIAFRVETFGGSPSVQVEKSTVSGAFVAETVGIVTIPNDANEAEETASLGTVSPGDKLRFNVLALGTAKNWTIAVELALV